MSTTTSGRRSSSSALALLAATLLASGARAGDLHVPADFPTIQEAVDAAQDGDQILVAAGSYTGPVLFDTKVDVALRGKGKVEIVGAEGPEPAVIVSGCTGVLIEHVRIVGAPGLGVMVIDSLFVTVSHCRVEDPGSVGVAVVDSDFVAIEHVVVTGAASDGIHATNSNGLNVSHCTLLDGGGDGIEVQDGLGVVVDHVTVKGVADVGILMIPDIDNLDGGIVRKCVVRDTGLAGLEIDGEGMLVEDNRILDAGGIGLLIQAGDDCIARNNRVIRPVSRGVFISDGEHQMLDNRIVQPGLAGILVSTAGLQVLSGNRVLKSATEGILITVDSDGCALTDNRITSSAGDGIVVDSDDTQLTGNRVHGAGDDGFEVQGASCVFLGNTGKGSAGFDLLDSTGSGNIYVDNDFGTTHIE